MDIQWIHVYMIGIYDRSMDISTDVHVKSVDMDMGVKFHIHDSLIRLYLATGVKMLSTVVCLKVYPPKIGKHSSTSF